MADAISVESVQPSKDGTKVTVTFRIPQSADSDVFLSEVVSARPQQTRVDDAILEALLLLRERFRRIQTELNYQIEVHQGLSPRNPA